jgi:hypothetical protein
MNRSRSNLRILSRHLPEGTEEKTTNISVRVVGILTKIRISCLSSASHNSHRLVKSLSEMR